jgi:transposase-like protein
VWLDYAQSSTCVSVATTKIRLKQDIEELLAARGIVVTYEAVRQWCLKFGQQYAKEIRRRRPRPGDTWFLDEVFITINGKRHYLWRAVDQDGDVLDILVQKHRDKRAARGDVCPKRDLIAGANHRPWFTETVSY